MSKQEVKLICNKCGKLQKPDKEQDSKNWKVFTRKKCKCGGTFKFKLVN